MKNFNFNNFEKIMLGGSIMLIIGGFMNLYTVHGSWDTVSKVGSMVSNGASFNLLPAIGVIVCVLLHLDQLALLAAIIETGFIGYTILFSPINNMELLTGSVSKGIGWYVLVIATFIILAGAVLNIVNKKNNG